MDVRVGLWRKLSTKELILLNCGVGEDSWESLELQGDQPVHPKGDQSWVFIGRSDVEAETPILWPHDENWLFKCWLIWKNPDPVKDWGQEEKGTTEDEMVGWHHRLDGHGFGWTPGVGDVQGGLVCCGSWDCKESDMTEQLNWTELKFPGLAYPSLSSDTQHHSISASLLEGVRAINLSLDNLNIFSFWRKSLSQRALA